MDVPYHSTEGHGWAVLQKLNEQKSMGLFCDVSVMVEGKIFLAHKNVLSACSGYFYAALSRNEQQQFLVLDNVYLEGFSHLLEFFYSYKIPSCHVQDFVHAAHALQVNLPHNFQVSSGTASLETIQAKKEVCGSHEDPEVPDDSIIEIRLSENIKVKNSSTSVNTRTGATSKFSESRQKHYPASQLKDQTILCKQPTHLNEPFVTKSSNFILNNALSQSEKMGRVYPTQESRTVPRPRSSFSEEVISVGSPDTTSEGAEEDDDDIILCEDSTMYVPSLRLDAVGSLNRSPLTLNEFRKYSRTVRSKNTPTGPSLQDERGSEADSELSEAIHRCNRCELLLTYTNYLLHQDDPGRILLQCSYCEKQFNYSCQLAMHQSSHHAKKLYQCDQCGKELSSLKKLRDHMAYHSEDRPHQCHLCDKAYKVKNDLTQHIRMKHMEASTGKPPLIQLCEFCGQAVKHYKSHKIFCSGIKKYKCDYCMQTFHRISELKRHTWTHTGELPYRCKICGKGCRHPSNLKKHIRTVHKEDMRVQINREHASPRFYKNSHPQAKSNNELLQQILSTTLSTLQSASSSSMGPVEQTVSSTATAAPVTLTYISMSTLAQQQQTQSANPLPLECVSATPDTTGST
ncbi:myoneurin-like [Ambystoma mexicanum]|uniref:myoneurin-like n=1 Tax=Ambystoma mexicanum TaxID=8296 RepID=UPI0037E78AD7